MIKKLIIFGGLAVIALGAVLYFTFSAILGRAIKAGVESYGPEFTGTEIRLGRVSLSPLSGKGAVGDLVIGNPKGYKAEKSFSCERIEMKVDAASLLGDHILINEILIRKPEVVFEKKLVGSNLNAILNNVESAAGESEEEAETGEELKFEISEFVLQEGSITLFVAGRGLTVPLPEIRLKNLGKEKGGITPRELTGEILKAVFSQFTAVAGKAVGAAIKGGTKTAGKAIDSGAEGIKEVGGKAAGAVEGLKGFFGKKKGG